MFYLPPQLILDTKKPAQLSISILWNVLACSLIVFLNYIWVLAIDIIAAVLLAVLGIIGFVHDDTSYLDNGQWLEDSMVWFDIEIAGITILGVSLYVAFLASDKHYRSCFHIP